MTTPKPHPRDVAAYTERAISVAPDEVLPPAVRPFAAAAREAVALAVEADAARGAASGAHTAAQEAYKLAVDEAAGSGGAMPSTAPLEDAAKALDEATKRAEGTHRNRGVRLAEYVAALKAHRDEHVAGIPSRVAAHRARVSELLGELEAEVDLIGAECGLAQWLNLVGRTPGLSSWQRRSGLDLPPNMVPVSVFAEGLRAAIDRTVEKAAPTPKGEPQPTLDRAALQAVPRPEVYV